MRDNFPVAFLCASSSSPFLRQGFSGQGEDGVCRARPQRGQEDGRQGRAGREGVESEGLTDTQREF